MPRNGSTSSRGDSSRSLLARIIETPHLARAVPHLAPQVLHRIIEQQGLEAIGELMPLITPAQIGGIFDIDLWRSPTPGGDERFDPARFGEWLEVLAEADVALAASTLAAVDPGVVTAALAQHILVFDPGVLLVPDGLDDDFAPIRRAIDTECSVEIGGFLIVGRRRDAWDALTSVLVELETDHRAAFDRLLVGCRALSSSDPEIDGLDNLLTASEQFMYDVAVDRDSRRERRGYATAQESRAFLQMARQLRLDDVAPPGRNPIAEGYFRSFSEVDPSEDAAVEIDTAEQVFEPDVEPSRAPTPATEDPRDGVAPLLELLVDAGVLAGAPRALLTAPERAASPVPLMQAAMNFVRDHDPETFVQRTHELAFLSNVLLAGCSLQARSFSLQEASDAVVATCNLGLEHWPRHWGNADAVDGCIPGSSIQQEFLAEHNLVTVFQVGWRVIYQRVCLEGAERLLAILAKLVRGSSNDPDTVESLHALHAKVRKGLDAGTPWSARDELEVIMTFDIPAWATLVGLVDECPVIHGAMAASTGARVLSINPSDFVFISTNTQIAAIHAFFDALPGILRE